MPQPQMPTMTNWRFEVDFERIGWLTIDTPNSPVNTLSRLSISELETALLGVEDLIASGEVIGLVIQSGKESGFIAGADVTGSVAPAPKPTGHWTWDGGTPVTVAQGDTVDSIARRYGVPASALIQANNLTLPATVHPGQQLVIPRYSAAPVASVAPATHPAAAAHRPASAPAMSQAGHPGVHVVVAGETLSKISRLYGKPVGEIAKANNLPLAAKLTVGDRLIIPGVRSSAARPNFSPAKAPR